MPRHNAKQDNSKSWSKWNRVRLKSDEIRSWRFEKQLSQRRAAEVCEMSEVTWRRCESGQLVQALTAARLAKKLGLELSELRLR